MTRLCQSLEFFFQSFQQNSNFEIDKLSIFIFSQKFTLISVSGRMNGQRHIVGTQKLNLHSNNNAQICFFLQKKKKFFFQQYISCQCIFVYFQYCLVIIAQKKMGWKQIIREINAKYFRQCLYNWTKSFTSFKADICR